MDRRSEVAVGGWVEKGYKIENGLNHRCRAVNGKMGYENKKNKGGGWKIL